MANSHTPNMRPVGEVQRFRPWASDRLMSRLRPSGKKRRPKVTVIEVGLFVLVTSTAMAIASVSTWWMLVYLVVMVVIFVTPGTWRAASSASESGVESDLVGIVDQESSLRVDRASGPDEIRSLNQFDSDLANVDLTGAMDSNPDLITAGVTKRRGRVRARKVTNPANEPVTDCRPVAWIQVVPGKFVRVESGNQAADPAQVEEVALRAYPAQETPAEATRAAQAETEPLADSESLTSSGIFPGEVGLISISDDCLSGPVAEEYGIAPSAFSVSPEVSPSVDSQDHAPGAVTEPESDPSPIVNQGERLSWRVMGSGRLWSQQGTSRRRSRRVIRGMAPAIPALGRASRRCNLCISPDTRSTVGFRFAPNVRRQQAACRAFGRMTHVHRALRPRSPPLSSRSA
jgi:hypothetical protein